MIVRRAPSVLAIVAIASMSAACVVASGDGTGDPNAVKVQEGIAHANVGDPNVNVDPAQPATPSVEGQVVPDVATFGPKPSHVESPSPNKGVDIGFSGAAPNDPNGPYADGPRPHPWEPPEEPTNPSDGSKPKIGGSKDDDGTKPHK